MAENVNKNRLMEMLVNKKPKSLSDSTATSQQITAEDVERLEKLTLSSSSVRVKKKTSIYDIVFKVDINEKIDEVNASIKLMKEMYREKLRTKVRETIIKHRIFKTKEEEIVNKKIEETIEKVSNVLGSIKDFTINSIDKVWGLIKKTAKYVTNVAIRIIDFLLGPFRLGWRLIDGFLTGLSPQLWNTIKKVSATIGTAAMWVWKIGKKMLEYVWEGVKTIFKFGYEVMATVASTLYKGGAFLFKFWFRMLINTLLNPAMLIINLPIFLGITSALFIALGSVTSIIIDLALPLLNQTFKIGESVLSWVWGGLQTFWKWITTTYKGSWLERAVDEYIVNGVYSWFMDIDIVKKVVKYIKLGYNWLQENGKIVIDYAVKGINIIKKYISEMSGESFVVKFINLLNSNEWLKMAPGTSKLVEYLNKKFGFLPGIRNGAIVAPENLQTVRSNIQSFSKQKIQTTLEYQSLKMIQEGKTEEEITKYLNETVISSLSKEISDSKMSEQEISENINSRLKQAQQIIKSGGKGAIPDYEKALSDQSKMIMVYEELAKQMKRGVMDPTNPETIAQLDKIRLNAVKVRQQFLERSRELKMPKTEKSLDDIQNSLKNIEIKFKGSSKLQSFEDYRTALRNKLDKEKWLAGIGEIPEILIDPSSSRIEKHVRVISAVGNSSLGLAKRFAVNFSILAANQIPSMGITDKGLGDKLVDYGVFNEKSYNVSLARSGVEEQVDIFNRQTDSTGSILSQANRAKGYERGGVNANDPTRIKPLNELSAMYVKEKVTNLEKNKTKEVEKNKEKTDIRNNITIIDTYITQEESYETYTISQLSRGLLSGS